MVVLTGANDIQFGKGSSALLLRFYLYFQNYSIVVGHPGAHALPQCSSMGYSLVVTRRHKKIVSFKLLTVNGDPRY